uniref:Uncharacterized protein n=1 Tax=Brassica campestris TaxID=3711 RepID=A0A3P6B3I2_BRACM|nr:unnamed protein product [Brassica rapa]
METLLSKTAEYHRAASSVIGMEEIQGRRHGMKLSFIDHIILLEKHPRYSPLRTRGRFFAG